MTGVALNNFGGIGMDIFGQKVDDKKEFLKDIFKLKRPYDDDLEISQVCKPSFFIEGV
jgi:hypothetical protein